MSLWADYTKELRGQGFRHWLEYPDCFIAYSFPEWGPIIFIHDMYVAPEMRRSGRGTALLNEVTEIGRKAGKRYAVAELEINTLTFEQAFNAQIASGFIPTAAQPGIICMRKVIDG